MPWSPGFIDGGRVEVTGVATILVHPGVARDARDTYDMDWRGGRTDKLAQPDTISLATTGAALGIDSKQIAATCSTTNGSATYASITADIFNELSHVLHAVPGITMTTVGTAVTFSQDVRGKLHVGDVVGTRTTYGFSRISAITNTGLGATLVAALPGGNATTISFSRIEGGCAGLTVRAGAETLRLVNTITAAGTQIVASGNAGTTTSGVTLTFGGETSSQIFMVHKVLLYTPGTGYSYTSMASIMRTTLLNTSLGSGVVVARRCVGIACNNGSSDLTLMDTQGDGALRTTFFRASQAFTGSRVINNGTANATWTDIDCSAIAPPNAVAVYGSTQGAASKIFYLAPSDGVAYATMGGSNDYQLGAIGSWQHAPMNRSQSLKYTNHTSSGSAYLEVGGHLLDMTMWP